MIEIIKCIPVTIKIVGDEKGDEKYCSVQCNWNKEIKHMNTCVLFDSWLVNRYKGLPSRLQICIKTFCLNDKKHENS